MSHPILLGGEDINTVAFHSNHVDPSPTQPIGNGALDMLIEIQSKAHGRWPVGRSFSRRDEGP